MTRNGQALKWGFYFQLDASNEAPARNAAKSQIVPRECKVLGRASCILNKRLAVGDDWVKDCFGKQIGLGALRCVSLIDCCR